MTFFACSQKETTSNESVSESSKKSKDIFYDKDSILYTTEYILEYYKGVSKGFDWLNVRDPKLYYSIGHYTNNTYILGFAPKKYKHQGLNIDYKTLGDPDWKEAREIILSKLNFSSGDKLLEKGDEMFPGVLVEINSYETMKRICETEELLYIESSIDEFMITYGSQFKY